MSLGVIVNGIVAVLGTLGGALFAGASIISIANMRVPWRGAPLVAALLIPVTFIVSGVGVWLPHAVSLSATLVGLIALPWCYGLAFVVAMLFSFKV